MTDDIVQDWLGRFKATALTRDLEGHMALISPEVRVFGVPGFEQLGFDDWYRQCAHEFPQGLLSAIDYRSIRVRSADRRRILFIALETTQTTNGGRSAQGVEMLLEHTADSWRLQQLRLLPEDEARHEGLL